MVIIAVDDERAALRSLERAILASVKSAEVLCFTSAEAALEYARCNPVDVAFLDIEMGGTNGLNLAKSLKDICRSVNIIFATGFSEYALDAHRVHASGYIMKPIDEAAVAYELDNLRTPVMSWSGERIRVKCFGGFGVFVGGSPLLFPRAKEKELFAYLVHKRGASVSNAEIAAVLWEDRVYNNSLQTQTRQVRTRLLKTLKEAGIENVIIRGWNTIAANVGAFSCDYYDFVAGVPEAIGSYTGEYMSDYSWAEFMIGYLDSRRK